VILMKHLIVQQMEVCARFVSFVVRLESSSEMCLDLDDAMLVGSIPTTIGLLTALTALHLAVNNLSGTVPTQIGNLSLLKELSIRENADLGGTLPVQLQYLTKLTELRTYGCVW
jgi:hypothetical protein